MEYVTPIITVLSGLGSLFLLVKGLIELSAIPTSRERSLYEFAYSLAQRSSDPALTSYALELAYKSLINDPTISTAQRQALLTLPDRVALIPLYLKARKLLTVQRSGPVLRWKSRWHQVKWYRRSVMGALLLVYTVLATAGLCALSGTYPTTSYAILDWILAMPPVLSVLCVLLGGAAFLRALRFKAAVELIAKAETVGPLPQ